MTTHILRASQLVRRPIGDVFSFFSRPENLARITPGGMSFELRSSDVEMRPGLEIEYRIRPLFGIPTGWRTRIERYEPPRIFEDVQLSGPYRRWEHTHTFAEVDGGTRVDDEVVYELPLGPLGDLAHDWLVRPELERIFRHRGQAIESIFAPRGATDSPLTIAVAGGTGFVGGAIAAELRRRGHRVIVLSHRGEASRGMLPDDVEIRRADVTRPEGLRDGLAGVDALAIALAFPNSPVEVPARGRTFEAVDAAGTEHLVAAARQSGVTRLLYVSGAGAALDAERHWFRAKWRAEEAVRSSGITWTIIRPTWVFGPGDVSLNRFVGFAARLPAVPMTNAGRQRLAPVFVDDVARLSADSLVDSHAEGQVFEIGGPETMEMREVIARALHVARRDRPVLPGPTPLIKLAAVPLGVLPEPPLTPAAVDFINQPAAVDLRPLLARMPRRLTPFEEGLRTYLGPDAGPGTVVFETEQRASSTRPATSPGTRDAEGARPAGR